jgi:hypothetical protein
MKVIRTLFVVAIATMALAPRIQASMYLYRAYEPNLQRWLNRDPMGDYGSAVYNSHLQIEHGSGLELTTLVRQSRIPAEWFKPVGLNPYLPVVNDLLDYVDPNGLDFLSCMANCVQSKDPLNNLGHVAACALGPVPKSWFGFPVMGSRFTSLLSMLGLGGGTAASGSNLLRLTGRVLSPLSTGYGLYLAYQEASCAGTCAGDSTSY